MPPDPPTAEPRRNIRIGKYEVLAHVATGGMGAVYKARDTETQREVAIKVLTGEMAAKPAMVERFRREARHAASLNHENIIRVYDFGESQGTLFLVMEFIEGIDLQEYIHSEGQLEPEESRQIMIQAARALNHAYQAGIVHRDIKPANFLLTRKHGRLVVKLADLGLAREASSDECRVTRAGTTVGTVDYMAPEQARDSGAADIRSDLYALGCTWFHMLAGEPPFPEGGLAERICKHMMDDPPDIREFNPQVSDDLAAILDRLLAKKPEDRFQTPAELVIALQELLPVTRSAPSSKRPSDTVVDADSSSTRSLPAPRPPATKITRRKSTSGSRAAARKDKNEPTFPWALVAGGAGLLGIILIVVLILLLGRGRTRPDILADVTPERAPSVAANSVVPTPAIKPELPTFPSTPLRPNPPAPKNDRLPALYKPARPIDLAALRAEVDRPWNDDRPAPPNIPVLRVARIPDGAGPCYPSLAEACAAAPPGQALVLEIHDNGPLFDPGLSLTGRDLIIRPGPGFRPLIVWDLARVCEEKGGPGGKTALPPLLTFLELKQGRLTLLGMDLVLQSPPGLASRLEVLQITGGSLDAAGCTFSLAGRQDAGIPLVRLLAGAAPSRCRLRQCYARGSSLVGLDLDASGTEVLLENCLLVGGPPPLLRLHAQHHPPGRLRLVRSTLIGSGDLLQIDSASKIPALEVWAWDALLTRCGEAAGGALLRLPVGATVAALKWQAVNSLYAGWGQLLGGSDMLIPGSDAQAWQRLWLRTEGDGAVREAWPPPPLRHAEDASVSSFRTQDSPVFFAATAAPQEPLGCPLSRLPAARDNWMALTVDRFVTPPLEPPGDPQAPSIPAPGDGRYHGESLDLTKTPLDLGLHLQQQQLAHSLGPCVVLQVRGTGEQPFTPVRLRKGTSLVLHVEPPAADAKPLTFILPPGQRTPSEALIEMEEGGLEVTGAEIRLPDSRFGSTVPSWLFKVAGGDLRLFRCRLFGPPVPPLRYRGLLCLQGSGQTGLDLARGCALNECVLTTSQAGIALQGVGARLLVYNSVIVAGQDALHLDLGASCKDRANVQCQLQRSTLAAGQALVYLHDLASASPPQEPVVIQSQDCAFLNPFITKNARPGLLHCEGRALGRGLLLWQSDGDLFDSRWHHGGLDGRRAGAAREAGFLAAAVGWYGSAPAGAGRGVAADV